MSQYDNIGSDYNIIKTLPYNRLEQHNFRKTVQPFLSGSDTSVIDFACGTGFYSSLLLSWGAPSLTGMDLSPAMVDGANARLASAVSSGSANFVVGDGFQPQLYPHPSSSASTTSKPSCGVSSKTFQSSVLRLNSARHSGSVSISSLLHSSFPLMPPSLAAAS